MGSNDRLAYRKFFATAGDPGTSSLHQPVKFSTRKIVDVPEWTLAEFFRMLPWSDVEPSSSSESAAGVYEGHILYIDMLKVDTQGHDLEVIRGAGDWLSERVVWIQPEMKVTGYTEQHDPQELSEFITSLGFTRVKRGARADCKDDLFLNSRLKHLQNISQVLCLGL